MVVSFIFNLSLLFGVVAAPTFLLIAYKYRKGIGAPVYVWHKPELVIVTIVFFVLSLISLIVGVSFFFSHFGYIESLQIEQLSKAQHLKYGISCMLMLSGFVTAYMGLRLIMVNIVTEDGIILNEKYIPFPSSRNLLMWDEISDFYVQPDYPNTQFTFIVKDGGVSFNRISLKVPIFLKEDFEAHLEQQLYSGKAILISPKISSFNFSEN